MVRPAEIGVLTGRGLKMVVSEERGALSYATHEDGLIDLGPGYRVSIHLHEVTLVSLFVFL